MMHLLARYLRDTRATALFEFAISVPIMLFMAFVLLEFVSYQLIRVKVDKASFMIANAITQLPISTQKSGTVSYGAVDSAAVADLIDRADGMVPQGGRGGMKVVAAGFSYIDHVYNSAVPGSPATPVNAPVLLWAKGEVFTANPPNSASTIAALGNNDHWGRGIQMQKAVFNDTNTQHALATYKQGSGEFFSCRVDPENVVMVEVFFDYKPIFAGLFSKIGHDPAHPENPPVNFLSEHTLVSRAFLNPRLGYIEALSGDAAFSSPANSYINTKPRGFCD